MRNVVLDNDFYPAFLSSFIVSFCITLAECFSFVFSGVSYVPALFICTLIIFLFWSILFFVNHVNICYLKKYSNFYISFISMLFVLLSVYLVKVVWLDGYLSLRPIYNVVTANQHRDTFSHASMAGGYSTYGVSSYLVNKTSLVKYHTFSHLILGLISKWLGVSTYLTYCFVFPVLFCPLYVFLLFVLCIVFKKKICKKSISFLDVVCVCSFIIGCIPTKLLEREAIRKSSYFVSEAFLVANCILLLYLLSLVNLFSKFNKNRKFFLLYILLINPLFIIILCFTKISVGFLLAVGWMFYLFKFHTKELKAWLLIFYYFIALLLGCLCMTSWGAGGGSHGIMLFAFVRKYCQAGISSLFSSYGLNFVAVIIVLVYRLHYENPTVKELLFSKKCWIEQLLFVLCLVSVLPGLFLDIEGGSAGYFSYVPEIFGVVLLVAYGIPDKIYEKIKTNRSDKVFFCSVFSIMLISLVMNASPLRTLKKYVSDVVFKTDGLKDALKNRKSNESIFDIVKQKMKEPYVDASFYKNIAEINKLTRFKKKEYALFIDESAELWEIYKNRGVSSILVYPALTNLLCLNEMYVDNDVAYNRAGNVLAKKERGGDWILISLCHIDREKKELKDVLTELPPNVKNIIVLEQDSYRVVPVK